MGERVNLVTGALGFNGSHLLRELLADGQKVIGTDLTEAVTNAPGSEVYPGIGLDLDHPNLELIPSNLLEPESLEFLADREITHVFHTASLYDYSAPMEKLWAVNVDGTANLLNQLDYESIERFLHWSTCGVFGKPRTAGEAGDNTNLPLNERNPSPKNTSNDENFSPEEKLVNDYSVSKWEQEQMVWREYRDNDLPLTVIRPAPVYGPGSNYGHGGIVLAIAYGLLPAIPSDAKNYITSSVHVEDVARFARYITEADQGIGEDYNLADNSVISYHEFLHHIALLSGRTMYDLPILRNSMIKPLFMGAAYAWNWLEKTLGLPRVRVFEIQSAVYMSSSYWISNRKALRTGFDFKYEDVKDGLQDLMTWFRERDWLNDPDQIFVVEPEGSKRS